MDYLELAKQYGGSLLKPPPEEKKEKKVDYRELAKQYGGTVTQEKPKPTVTPTSKQTTAALDTSRADVGLFQAEIEFGVTPEQTPEAKKAVAFKDIYTDKNNKKVFSEFMVARMGKEGFQKKGESDEDYARRFTSHMRDIGTDVGLARELTWAANARDPERAKAQAAAELFENMASFYEEGGEGFRALMQNIRGALNPLESPTTYLGLGVGKIASGAIKRGVTKGMFGSRAKTTALGVGVEGAAAAATNVAQQRLEIERISDPEERAAAELDLKQVALSTAIGGAFGALQVRSIANPKDFEKDLNKYQQKLQGKQFVGPVLPAEAKIKKALEEYHFDVFEMFDPVEGRRVLDKLSPEEELVNSKIKNTVGKKIVDIAGHIILSDIKKFGPRGDEKISDAVRRVVIEEIPNLDETVLEGALARAGINTKEFMDAARTSLAEAASIMQAYSVLGRNVEKTLKGIARVDPDAEEIINRYFDPSYKPPGIGSKALALIKRGERESVALSVSAIITTVRNIYGTTKALTFDTAASVLEKSIWTLGSTVDVMASKGFKAGKQEFNQGMRDAFADSFRVFANMTRSNETRLLVDDILKYNPKINDMLFSIETAATQTVTEKSRKISGFAKLANTFNAAQDSFLRRSIFLASVQNRLKEVGMDAMEFVANNRAIPPDVLKNAADDALKATFSYNPKNKPNSTGVENFFESATSDVLKVFEKIPGSTLIAPFPRFMANAVRFQYRYSPLGAAYGMNDMAKAMIGIRQNKEGADVLFREGWKKFNQGVVGMGAFYAAYKYREANQDTLWYEYKTASGDTADLRGDFPTPVYLAWADFIIKVQNNIPNDTKIQDLVEQIFGIKMGAGTQNIFLDNISKMIDQSDERSADRLEKILGDAMGEFFGRFTAPFKSVVEVFALIDEDSAKARDPNVSALEFEGDEGLMEGIGDAAEQAVKRVANKLPVAKELLPEAVTYFREQTPSRPGEFFTSLTGMRMTPARNRVEQEFVDLSIEPYKYYKPSGVRAFDRLTIENTLPVVLDRMTEFVTSKEYPNMTKLQRRTEAEEILKESVKAGRDLTMKTLEKIAEESGEEAPAIRQAIFKSAFFKLNPNERALVNEAYKKENGISMEKAGAYEELYDYLGAKQPRQPYQAKD